MEFGRSCDVSAEGHVMFVTRALLVLAWVAVPLCSILFVAPALADEPEKKASAEGDADHKLAADKSGEKEKAEADGAHKSDSHGGGHGNDFDLGHANAGPAQSSPEE